MGNRKTDQGDTPSVFYRSCKSGGQSRAPGRGVPTALMIQSNTCVTNSPVTGPSSRAVMGAALTDVRSVPSNPQGGTTARLA